MAKLLYTSIQGRDGSRAYVFSPRVRWATVHEEHLPAVVVFGRDSTACFKASDLDKGDLPPTVRAILEQLADDLDESSHGTE